MKTKLLTSAFWYKRKDGFWPNFAFLTLMDALIMAMSLKIILGDTTCHAALTSNWQWWTYWIVLAQYPSVRCSSRTNELTACLMWLEANQKAKYKWKFLFLTPAIMIFYEWLSHGGFWGLGLRENLWLSKSDFWFWEYSSWFFWLVTQNFQLLSSNLMQQKPQVFSCPVSNIYVWTVFLSVLPALLHQWQETNSILRCQVIEKSLPTWSQLSFKASLIAHQTEGFIPWGTTMVRFYDWAIHPPQTSTHTFLSHKYDREWFSFLWTWTSLMTWLPQRRDCPKEKCKRKKKEQKKGGGLGNPSILCGNLGGGVLFSWCGDGSLWPNLNSPHQWTAGLKLIHVLLSHYMPPSS